MGLSIHLSKEEATMTLGKPQEDSTINCPRCRRPNPARLIYCAAVECAATLHPGRMDCGGCRAEIPVNARFCPDCGQATGFGTVPETFTPRAIRSGRAGK